ncbi:MAG: hypothetical protein Q4A62_02575 [Eikenella sp.]|nr:hypothetical protein [Eikenella sp.]
MTSSININSTESLLEFASLQMASEALWERKNLLPTELSNNLDLDLIKILITGNQHASKFTENQAIEFSKSWKVIAHVGNTTTGFSATVFEALNDNTAAGIRAGDQVISFRSTEFIDDAARDNQATNTLEIADKGFAFGQLADMLDWVRGLQQNGTLKDRVKITGYSLGGHLATSFNLLQQSGKKLKEEIRTSISRGYLKAVSCRIGGFQVVCLHNFFSVAEQLGMEFACLPSNELGFTPAVSGSLYRK